MNNLQFNLDENSLYQPLSPDVIDISSNSDSEFVVDPGNIPQMEETFRINPANHNALTTFMGAATAMLFPSDGAIIFQGDKIDTAGTGIEQELMELFEGNHIPSLTSRTSFVDNKWKRQRTRSKLLIRPL